MMTYSISFQELAKIQQEILSKQEPTTLEKAKKQVQSLQQSSLKKINNRKR